MRRHDAKSWWVTDKRKTKISTERVARILFPLTICARELISDTMCQQLSSQPLRAGRQDEACAYEIVFMLNRAWFLKPLGLSRVAVLSSLV